MKLSLGLSPRDYTVSGGAVAYDTDAQAYFTANTAITSDADKNAINTFYLGLKSDGVYTKIKAMYLPLWSSASSNKWNLVNPLDTNAAFRLTFATGMTFTSGGMAGNGTTGYAITQLVPNTNLTNNSTSFGIYCRTNLDALQYDCGIQRTTGTTGAFNLLTRYSNNLYSDHYNNSTNRILTANTNSQGFYQSIRTTSTSFKVFKNSAQLGTTNTSASSGFGGLTNNFLIGCLNDTGTPSFYSARQYSLAYLGDGLTDTDATNFNTRVNTLMTYFGINV